MVTVIDVPYRISTMKRIKYLLVAVCFFSMFYDGKTQEIKLAGNSVYFEFLGNGGLYSFNYERSFTPNISGRIGFARWSIIDIMSKNTTGKMTTIPVLLTYLTGHKKSHFEIGGGFLFGKENNYNESNPIINLTSVIGYRFQTPGMGFVFRTGLTPFLSLDNKANYPDPGLFLSGGISVGFHF